MITKHARIALLFWSLFLFSTITSAAEQVKGIYLTQYSFENTSFLTNIIKHAKAAGITTFVVDLERPSKRYQENLALVKANHINYVARIIMFPGGGTPAVINDPTQWQKKYTLVKQAVAWGASQIQLDYIRYNTKQKPSPENAKHILAIIQWYKDKLSGQNIPLQVDVFGIASFGESKYIGQNIKLFSQTVDAICPMVYPSHYVPFPEHFKHPYDTVYVSLKHIKGQFGGDQMPIKMYPYIELSNYHYPMSHQKTLEYIQAQLNAVQAAGADGWYAWSPHNRYDNLFYVLENQRQTAGDQDAKPATTADATPAGTPAATPAATMGNVKPADAADAKPAVTAAAKPAAITNAIKPATTTADAKPVVAAQPKLVVRTAAATPIKPEFTSRTAWRWHPNQ